MASVKDERKPKTGEAELRPIRRYTLEELLKGVSEDVAEELRRLSAEIEESYPPVGREI